MKRTYNKLHIAGPILAGGSFQHHSKHLGVDAYVVEFLAWQAGFFLQLGDPRVGRAAEKDLLSQLVDT